MKGKQTQDPRRARVSVGDQRPEYTNGLAQSGRRIPLLLSLFVLFKSSVDCMKPTYLREDHLLYSVYNLNVNLM